MAKKSDALTVLAVKNAKPGKHFDGKGLYLEVTESGSRIWRLKFRHAGRESRATLGHFPEVELSQARKRAEAARAQLSNGISPNAAKQRNIAATKRERQAAFPIVARAWLEARRPGWAEETHRKAAFVVATYLAPKLRRASLVTLDTEQANKALRGIPPSLARKARGYLGQIVAYATQEGLRDDKQPLSLRGALPKARKGNIPAAIEIADVRKLLQAIAEYPTPVTRAALMIAALTAQRPGNVAAMEWAEINLDAAEWLIPAGKMKTAHAHLVPLSRQAIEILSTMHAYTEGHRFVFPPLARQSTPHLHRDALSAALRRMGFQGAHATHGFRGMFRTLARERLEIPADVLEAQLAHAKKGEVQKAYDRTAFVRQRTVALQRWADFLDGLRAGGNVVPLNRKAR